MPALDSRLDISKNTLTEILRCEVKRYVGYSPQGTMYPVLDDESGVYLVAWVDNVRNDPQRIPVDIVVMARLVGEY